MNTDKNIPQKSDLNYSICYREINRKGKEH